MSAADRNRGLGRGLSALLGEADTANEAKDAERAPVSGPSGVREIPIELISPNPDQPRKLIGEAELETLAKSIAEKGVVQPILVRPLSGPDERYQIVAGERRWRAAQRAQLHEIPAVIRELTDQETLEIGIVENIQRADLNPVEEARAYQQLIERFGHSQDEVARAVSKSRSHVANMVRLLALPDEVLDHLAEGRLSAGHARAIASTPDPAGLAAQIVEQGLSVRAAESLARQASDRPEPTGAPKASRPAADAPAKDADTRDFERHIAERLGLEVDIRHDGKGGELRVRYTTLEQLDDLARRLTGGTL